METKPLVNPTVGVVTRTKNRPILLKRALDSVLGQSYQHWRQIVINDGGEPDAVEKLIAERRGIAAGRVDVIHNQVSLGMEAASNKAIRALDTDFLVIHDDDDSWHPDFLLEAIRALQAAPEWPYAGAVCQSIRIIESIQGNSVIEQSRDPFNEWLPSVTFMRQLESNCFPPISFLFERAAFEDVGPFREDLPVLGDWEFSIRFMAKYEVLIIPKFLANYHHRSKNETSTYGNTVMVGVDRHEAYRKLLLNQLLREDLQASRIGLGVMVNFANQYGKLHEHMNFIESSFRKKKKWIWK